MPDVHGEFTGRSTDQLIRDAACKIFLNNPEIIVFCWEQRRKDLEEHNDLVRTYGFGFIDGACWATKHILDGTFELSLTVKDKIRKGDTDGPTA